MKHLLLLEEETTNQTTMVVPERSSIAPRGAALSSFAAPSSAANHCKPSQVRVVVRIPPLVRDHETESWIKNAEANNFKDSSSSCCCWSDTNHGPQR